MENYRNKWVNSVAVLISLIFIVAGALMLYYGEKNKISLLEHFGYVLLPLGVIEFFAHLFFTKHYTGEIQEKMYEVFDKQDNIRKKGVTDIVYLSGIDDFFNLLLTNNVSGSNIKMCIIYFDEIGKINQDDFLKKIKQVLANDNIIEIIMPDTSYSDVRAELNLRARFASGLDIVAEVNRTAEFISENFSGNDSLHIIKHRQFISFPLLFDGTRWFMGTYMSHNSAYGENQQFIVAHDNGATSLGGQLWKHYKTLKERAEKDSAKDKIQYKGFSSAGDFLDQNYFANDKGPASNFLGKTYNLYTHSVYRHFDEFKGKRRHYISKHVLSFDSKISKNAISVEFSTVTEKSPEKKFIVKYNGICTFEKEMGSILILLFPYAILDSDSNALMSNETETMHRSPIIISGKIIKDSQIEKKNIDGDDKMLVLHMTLFSKHAGSTQSKVGILQLKDDNSSKPELINDFNLSQTKDTTNEDLVKLLLMRSSKVILKSVDKHTINEAKELKLWLSANYGDLTSELKSTEFILLYSKNNSDGTGKSKLERATLNILCNGIALLKRKTENGIEEIYFGEVNKRYTESNDQNKILYIKFIATEPTKEGQRVSGINQNYRELFLTVFWRKDFDITRGILTGDRDAVSREDKIVLNSHICFVVKNNDEYQTLNKSGQIDNKINEILGAKGFDHSQYSKTPNNHDIGKILRSQEIEYDPSLCSFKQLLA